MREIYALDDERLLLVASDRISTFDVILPTPIPDKGRVLTGMSAFWFARTSEIVPNHLLELGDDGRSTICRRLEMLPVEFVVRGYLSGSSWVDYQASGSVCGHALPPGLVESDRLADADRDAGDEGRRGSRPQHHRGRGGRAVRGRGVRGGTRRRSRPLRVRVGPRRGARHRPRRHQVRVRRRSRRRRHARRRGADARLVAVLARRLATPPAARSRRSTSSTCATTASRPGGTAPIPAPRCPTTSSQGTRARYIDAFERLTEISFAAYLSDPKVVL